LLSLLFFGFSHGTQHGVTLGLVALDTAIELDDRRPLQDGNPFPWRQERDGVTKAALSTNAIDSRSDARFAFSGPGSVTPARVEERLHRDSSTGVELVSNGSNVRIGESGLLVEQLTAALECQHAAAG